MNHPDEIRPLVKMIRPHVAVITTIAPAHLGNFKNIKEIAAAKAEIFEGLDAGGHVVLNRDNDQFNFLERTAQSLGVAAYPFLRPACEGRIPARRIQRLG